MTASQAMETFSIKESSFCLYYSYTPVNLPVVVGIGYMNDLTGYGATMDDSSYLAVDIILDNIF